MVIAAETPNTTPLLASWPPRLPYGCHLLVAHLPECAVACNHHVLFRPPVSIPQVLLQRRVHPLVLWNMAEAAPPDAQQGLLGKAGRPGFQSWGDDRLDKTSSSTPVATQIASNSVLLMYVDTLTWVEGGCLAARRVGLPHRGPPASPTLTPHPTIPHPTTPPAHHQPLVPELLQVGFAKEQALVDGVVHSKVAVQHLKVSDKVCG